jgi:Tol biopolymer transport system component/DNA-binding winged helix-turn-helix (wHTH) protein
MSGPDLATKVVRFGVFEVDLRTAELRKQGVRIRLPEQSFQVLEALLLRPGGLVTREELKQKLWPSDTFVDFEHGLNAAVNRVREALGDTSDNPRFVETLPRRGYRFIAPLESSQVELPSSGTLPPTRVPEARGVDSSLRHRAMKPVLLALAAVLLILLSVLYLVQLKDKAGSAREADVRVSPLTSLPGNEMWPALSPDGKQIVFAWDGGRTTGKSAYDLYIKVIGGERIVQLTHRPAEAMIPTWSPDGTTIAFIRVHGPERGVFTMSVLGGPERKLDDFTDELYTIVSSLSWSPDGRQLLYGGNGDLRFLTVETGEVRTIERPAQCKAAYIPVFSPNGQWIAFLCESVNGTNEITRTSQKGDQVKSLHVFPDLPRSIAWSGDSRRIILADSGGLLEIDGNGGQPHRLPFAQTAVGEQIASRGNRLVYVQMHDSVNIWRVDLKSGSSRSLLAPTSRSQRAPTISPDGKRIAFESDRSGTEEVWMANLDGSDAVQLSDFHALTGTPRWSPDGRKIAFDSRASGEAALYLVDPATALPKRIVTNGITGSVPTWSSDGKWIYFTSETSHSSEQDAIYRVAPAGGTPELVTKTHGYNVQHSKDGRFLYFFAAKIATNGVIHVLDLATGEEQPLKGMPSLDYPPNWVVGSKGIFYIDSASDPAAIAFYEFSSARVTRRIPIGKVTEYWGGLALSPDETWIAYSQSNTQGSDLMLADGVE